MEKKINKRDGSLAHGKLELGQISDRAKDKRQQKALKSCNLVESASGVPEAVVAPSPCS